MNNTLRYKGNFGELELYIDDRPNVTSQKSFGDYGKNIFGNMWENEGEKGVINGTVTNNIFEGTWENKGESGLITLDLNNGKLDGKWKRGMEEGPMTGKWTGTMLPRVYDKVVIVECYSDDDPSYEQWISLSVETEFDSLNVSNYHAFIDHHRSEILDAMTDALDNDEIDKLKDENPEGGNFHYLHVTKLGNQTFEYLNPSTKDGIGDYSREELKNCIEFYGWDLSIENLLNEGEDAIERIEEGIRELSFGTHYFFNDDNY